MAGDVVPESPTSVTHLIPISVANSIPAGTPSPEAPIGGSGPDGSEAGTPSQFLPTCGLSSDGFAVLARLSVVAGVKARPRVLAFRKCAVGDAFGLI